MNLSLSNLAWDNHNSEEILEFIKYIGINHIEGVFSKIGNWEQLSEETILDFKKKLNKKNIQIKSLQSLFYNTQCDSIFNDNFLIHLKKIIEYSKTLDVKILVFGSPSLRKKTTDWETQIDIIFEKIDNLLDNTGLIFLIEPNSKIYGGEFFFTVSEIVKFIQKNNYKNIKTMIDTHNVFLENETPSNVLEKYFEYIEHIHISENNLKPIENFTFHKKFSNKLKKFNYDKLITYEVLSCDNLKDSIKIFYNIYS